MRVSIRLIYVLFALLKRLITDTTASNGRYVSVNVMFPHLHFTGVCAFPYATQRSIAFFISVSPTHYPYAHRTRHFLANSHVSLLN